MNRQATLHSAKKRVVDILRGFPGVQGIGLTWDDAGDQVILVNVRPGTEQRVRQQLHRYRNDETLRGVDIVIDVVDNIRFT